MKTLHEFATTEMLTHLLVKERAKCRRRNRDDEHKQLNKECDIDELPTRKKLSRMMPPRDTWVRPSKRNKLKNGAQDRSKIAEKALLLTIKRDRKRQKEGATFGYLDELDAFFTRIRERLLSENLCFEAPHLKPILKDVKRLDDGTRLVTCRPLSTYTRLEDKIVQSLTSRYLTKYFDRYLHKNILSFRPARDFMSKAHHVTDFNDGIRLVKAFRENHFNRPIYAADCDIKKFFDIIPHDVVRGCFMRLLDKTDLSVDGKQQVMKVLEAYLRSYNFYTNTWMEAERNPGVFNKVRSRLRDKGNLNTYQLKWVDEIWQKPQEDYIKLGVAQGGSLSPLVANIVLNDVDNVFIAQPDDNRLFVRFCDDMILMHTDYDKCCRLMEAYTRSLAEHGLYYHDFERVEDCSPKHFWEIKSHLPFLWDDGKGNSNRYIGFLGYEMRRDGRMRLRKSNMKKFDEKLKRQVYVFHRMQKNLPEDEFKMYKEKTLKNILDGVKFYEAFDKQRFEKGEQYRHLKKLCERLDKRFTPKSP